MKWKKCKSNLEDVSFSYIVVRKGKRPEKPTISTSALATISPLPIDSSSEVTNTSGVEVVKEEGEASSSDDFTTQAYGWRRLVAPPIKNKGHIILDSCTSEGKPKKLGIA